MEEIKVGDFIRTELGQIARVDKDLKEFIDEHRSISERDIVEFLGKIKHSKNIIDIIEEGDILQINKEKYEVVYDRSYNKLGLLIPNREKLGIRHCSLQYIFSKQGISEFKNIRVVTKEQFSNIEYRLEN